MGTLDTNNRLQKDLLADERFVSLGRDNWAAATAVPAGSAAADEPVFLDLLH